MAEEEKHRQEKKVTEQKIPFPHDTYWQFQSKQTDGGSTIKWIVFGVIVIIVHLLIRS